MVVVDNWEEAKDSNLSESLPHPVEVSLEEKVEQLNVAEPLDGLKAQALEIQTVPLVAIDDAVAEALAYPSKRCHVINFEELIERYIADKTEDVLQFPSSLSTYQRMLAHRVAHYYGLNTSTVDNEDNLGRVFASRTNSTCIPKEKLSDLIPEQPNGGSRAPPSFITNAGKPKLLTKSQRHDAAAAGGSREYPNAVPGAGAGPRDGAASQPPQEIIREREEEYHRYREKLGLGQSPQPAAGDSGAVEGGYSGGPGGRMPYGRGDFAPGRGTGRGAGRADGGRGRKAVYRDKDKDLSDPDYRRGGNRVNKFNPSSINPAGGLYQIPTYQTEFPALMQYGQPPHMAMAHAVWPPGAPQGVRMPGHVVPKPAKNYVANGYYPNGVAGSTFSNNGNGNNGNASSPNAGGASNIVSNSSSPVATATSGNVVGGVVAGGNNGGSNNNGNGSGNSSYANSPRQVGGSSGARDRANAEFGPAGFYPGHASNAANSPASNGQGNAGPNHRVHSADRHNSGNSSGGPGRRSSQQYGVQMGPYAVPMPGMHIAMVNPHGVPMSQQQYAHPAGYAAYPGGPAPPPSNVPMGSYGYLAQAPPAGQEGIVSIPMYGYPQMYPHGPVVQSGPPGAPMALRPMAVYSMPMHGVYAPGQQYEMGTGGGPVAVYPGAQVPPGAGPNNTDGRGGHGHVLQLAPLSQHHQHGAPAYGHGGADSQHGNVYQHGSSASGGSGGGGPRHHPQQNSYQQQHPQQHAHHHQGGKSYHYQKSHHHHQQPQHQQVAPVATSVQDVSAAAAQVSQAPPLAAPQQNARVVESAADPAVTAVGIPAAGATSAEVSGDVPTISTAHVVVAPATAAEILSVLAAGVVAIGPTTAQSAAAASPVFVPVESAKPKAEESVTKEASYRRDSLTVAAGAEASGVSEAAAPVTPAVVAALGGGDGPPAEAV